MWDGADNSSTAVASIEYYISKPDPICAFSSCVVQDDGKTGTLKSWNVDMEKEEVSFTVDTSFNRLSDPFRVEC